ncbi:hypothetical protein T484DRAFT_1800463 [Baffinella frigidus]|nr:hypothetical protein T484DRAFT_1800463 [Cryptophyta sp. CCMP2293]
MVNVIARAAGFISEALEVLRASRALCPALFKVRVMDTLALYFRAEASLPPSRVGRALLRVQAQETRAALEQMVQLSLVMLADESSWTDPTAQRVVVATGRALVEMLQGSMSLRVLAARLGMLHVAVDLLESPEVALCELGISLLDALLMGGAPALVALLVKVEKVVSRLDALLMGGAPALVALLVKVEKNDAEGYSSFSSAVPRAVQSLLDAVKKAHAPIDGGGVTGGAGRKGIDQGSVQNLMDDERSAAMKGMQTLQTEAVRAHAATKTLQTEAAFAHAATKVEWEGVVTGALSVLTAIAGGWEGDGRRPGQKNGRMGPEGWDRVKVVRDNSHASLFEAGVVEEATLLLQHTNCEIRRRCLALLHVLLRGPEASSHTHHHQHRMQLISEATRAINEAVSDDMAASSGLRRMQALAVGAAAAAKEASSHGGRPPTAPPPGTVDSAVLVVDGGEEEKIVGRLREVIEVHVGLHQDRALLEEAVEAMTLLLRSGPRIRTLFYEQGGVDMLVAALVEADVEVRGCAAEMLARAAWEDAGPNDELAPEDSLAMHLETQRAREAAVALVG